MIPDWVELPSEEANLFNPAFCSLILFSGVKGYLEVDSEGMPFLLAFLVLPIVLHKATRQALPHTTASSMMGWLESNPNVLVQFAEHVRGLAGFVKQTILFSTSHGLLRIASSGNFLVCSKLRRYTYFEKSTTPEVLECLKKAVFVGRWIAKSGSLQAIMTLWGIRV